MSARHDHSRGNSFGFNIRHPLFAPNDGLRGFEWILKAQPGRTEWESRRSGNATGKAGGNGRRDGGPRPRRAGRPPRRPPSGPSGRLRRAIPASGGFISSARFCGLGRSARIRTSMWAWRGMTDTGCSISGGSWRPRPPAGPSMCARWIQRIPSPSACRSEDD
jgi:hypothetical protein